MKAIIEQIIQLKGFVTIVDITGKEVRYFEPISTYFEETDDVIFLTRDRDNGETECINVNTIVKIY